MGRTHPPAFQFYPDDFASDGVVEAMTTEEVGAYILILCKAWREDPPGTIPDDDRILARWARLSTKDWQRCRGHILAAFEPAGNRWIQKRMAMTYADLLDFKEEKSKAGKVGAKKRWQSHASAMAVPSSCHASANGKPIANDSSASASASAYKGSSSGGDPAMQDAVANFLAVWNASPHTRKVPDQFGLGRLDRVIDRFTNPSWLEHWPKALAKLPLKAFTGGDKTIAVSWFLDESTVPDILSGKYDFEPNATRGQAPKQNPKASDLVDWDKL